MQRKGDAKAITDGVARAPQVPVSHEQLATRTKQSEQLFR